MTRRGMDHHDPSRDEPVLDALSSLPGGAPDLTGAIMGRLGYMRIAPGELRRRALRRWFWRGAIGLGLIAVTAVGVRVHNASARARGPAALPVHEAIDHDFRRHYRGINSFIETIRDLAPATPDTRPDSRRETRPDPFGVNPPGIPPERREDVAGRWA